MEEIWKDIKGFEGVYQVSNLGRVKSVDRFVLDTLGRLQHREGKLKAQTLNQDGYLTVKASKNHEESEEKKNYIRKERTYGEMQRSFALGDVDVEKIEASFSNGMLKLVIPKQEKVDTTKRIEIK